MRASFTRHRYELPTLGVFFALALVELFAVHLLIALWSPTAAWILSALTVLALAQIVLLVHGMIRSPTHVDETTITVLHGRRSRVVVPLSSISSIEEVAFQPEEKGPRTLRATVLAQPNVAIRLSAPLQHGKRTLSTITMRLDEPAAFLATVRARLAAE